MADIQDAILSSLSTENVKRYVAYVEECFRADLAIRDTAFRQLQRDFDNLVNRVKDLESQRDDTLNEAPVESHSQTVPEPVGAYSSASSAQSD